MRRRRQQAISFTDNVMHHSDLFQRSANFANYFTSCPTATIQRETKHTLG